MRVLSIICGVLAGLALLLGLIPLLGWLNWIFVLPPAILGLIFGALSGDRNAITLNAVVAVIAVLRLFLGGGFI